MTDRGHRAHRLSCGRQAWPVVATRGQPWLGQAGAGIGAIGRARTGRVESDGRHIECGGQSCPRLSRARARPSLSLSLQHNARVWQTSSTSRRVTEDTPSH